MITAEKTYLSCAETAKLVRAELKRSFPGTKFSVRSDVYAGGASIRVRWTDGPLEKNVRAKLVGFSGADFDGMIDLKVNIESWLHPDGTATIAHRHGTNGSFTEIIGDPIGPNARLVHFGADYIFCNREISPEFYEELLVELEAKTGRTITRDRNEHWRTEIPAAVDRLDGTLYHMVESETASVASLVNQLQGWRARG